MKYLIFIPLLIAGCATEKVYNRAPLSEQILRVREAYPEKLTNSVCLEYKNDVCTKLDIVAYDLNDADFRAKANDFKFICQIADKRFRICRDIPGYCRWELKCEKHNFLGGFGCKRYQQTIIMAKEHKYLLDAKTVCSKKD